MNHTNFALGFIYCSEWQNWDLRFCVLFIHFPIFTVMMNESKGGLVLADFVLGGKFFCSPFSFFKFVIITTICGSQKVGN